MTAPTASAPMCDHADMPRGRFRLDVFRRGRLVERVDEPNLIVTNAKVILAGLAGGSRTAPGITTLGIGTSLAAPVYGNTTLTQGHYKLLDGVSYPVPGEAMFAFSLGSAEANGTAIGEFGLLSADGLLFARKVRSFDALLKDQTMSFSRTWTNQFA